MYDKAFKNYYIDWYLVNNDKLNILKLQDENNLLYLLIVGILLKNCIVKQFK